MEGKEYTNWIGFGARVKDARKRIGMTSEKLAEKSHRTENFILRIESGKKVAVWSEGYFDYLSDNKDRYNVIFWKYNNWNINFI